MTWGTFAALLAAVATTLTALGQFVRPSTDHLWYKRWLEILENAQTDDDRAIARERLRYYVLEFAINDRTRKDRRASVWGGLFVSAVGLVVGVFGLGMLQGPGASAWGWVIALLGAIPYVVGLIAVSVVPDRLRARARENLKQEQLEHRTTSDPSVERVPSVEADEVSEQGPRHTEDSDKART